MLNRRLFMSLAAILPGIGVAASAAKAETKKQQVAYHVSELKKVGFVLRNIRNHIKGMGGPGKVEIILVAHGPALKAFHTMSGDQGVLSSLKKLTGGGAVSFSACGNTMHALKMTMDDLPAGTYHATQGGVVRLAQLQEAGYLYLRP